MIRIICIALLIIPAVHAQAIPESLREAFDPPRELQGVMGKYRSPLLFDDGTPVKNATDWARRRKQIVDYWHQQMGAWPEPITPKVEILSTEKLGEITLQKMRIQTAPLRTIEDCFLLTPPGKGPFPGVVVVFYEAGTAIGRGKSEQRDFAIRLARRGFVALSLGGNPSTYYPNIKECRIQPLSFHAYEASNCRRFLTSLPMVRAQQIGVIGHSYGGKWAMFAACFDDQFAFGVWSDPGIAFDESRSNVNYWEPWYLGFDPKLPKQRNPGIPRDDNPRTGPYRQLMAEGRDLHEVQALMAPRPFLVSGGAEDSKQRWIPLNHVRAVNDLLGAKNRIAMTNRPGHDPTPESNQQIEAFVDYVLGR